MSLEDLKELKDKKVLYDHSLDKKIRISGIVKLNFKKLIIVIYLIF